MAVALALLAAALFGGGDFLGGLATRRSSLVAVLFVSHAAGFLAIAGVAALVGGSVTAGDLLAGFLGGVFGGLGVALLFRGFATGLMAAVAPVTGVVAAGLPVLVGLALGERPSVRALAGILIAIAAVALVGAGGEMEKRISVPTLLLAIGAGAAFAAFYVALSRAAPAAELWPLVAARATTTTGFGIAFTAVAARGGRPLHRVRGGPAALIVASAVCDVAANACYLFAVHNGLLSIVAVLVSLYPAATVACSFGFLGERLHRVQLAGVAAALVGVALMSAG
jgi:drug/metabolite transporter (DMT)-like permease